MQFSGRETIGASAHDIWAALFDPEVLRACIPGCESVERVDERTFLAKVVLKIGPVKARFAGRVELRELEPPRRCVIAGEGQGGIAGFAKGQADVRLTEEAGATEVAYVVEAAIGGKLAQLGSRLIQATFNSLSTQFFRNLNQQLGGADAVPERAST